MVAARGVGWGGVDSVEGASLAYRPSLHRSPSPIRDSLRKSVNEKALILVWLLTHDNQQSVIRTCKIGLVLLWHSIISNLNLFRSILTSSELIVSQSYVVWPMSFYVLTVKKALTAPIFLNLLNFGRK